MKTIKRINNRMTKIIAIAFGSAIILSGCSNSMFNKAMEQGKLAVANKDYDKAKASFELALEEKEDDGAKNMLQQVDSMLAGLKAKDNSDIGEAIKCFDEVIAKDSTLTSMVEEAQQVKIELQGIQDKINQYEESILNAENMINEKNYAESKDILTQVIEETKEQIVFATQNEKAREVLNQVHAEVAQLEAHRKEEARKQEEEKKKQEEEAKKQAQAKKKSPFEEAIKIAEGQFGGGAIHIETMNDEGRIFYYFVSEGYPKVSIIVDTVGELYDPYLYEANGWLIELDRAEEYYNIDM